MCRLKTPARLPAAVLAANTSMRGVEVKRVRRKDVDLEKMWDIDSATGKGVLYVGHSKIVMGRKAKLPQILAQYPQLTQDGMAAAFRYAADVLKGEHVWDLKTTA